MTARILKYTLPVDDQWHTFDLTGPILHVACQQHADEVQMWSRFDPREITTRRSFRIFGTGHELPDDEPCTYVGTALTRSGALVWHVMERGVPS